VEVVKGIGREAGLRGYYRGLSANLIGVTPEKAIKLTVNDLARKTLARQRDLADDSELPALEGMLAGAVAGACQSVATNPMEIVKINMQLNQQTASPKGLVATVQALGWRGLYKGTAATLMRDVPFSMIFFQSFAGLEAGLRRTQGTEQLGLPWVLLAGFGAGCIGAVAATPMDLVKTRYQAEWFASKLGGTSACRSIPRIWAETIREEGASALFKGSLQRCFIVGPLFGISLAVFHLQQRLLL
jgi:solute carrier family 25 aspartate/glutamate transporter 12/13